MKIYNPSFEKERKEDLALLRLYKTCHEDDLRDKIREKFKVNIWKARRMVKSIKNPCFRRYIVKNKVQRYCRIRNSSLLYENPNKLFIYGLRCPVDGKMKYVGVTKNLNRRTSTHRSGSKIRSFRVWMNKINKCPTIQILERPLKNQALIREKYWIRYFSKRNELFNVNKIF